MTLFSSVRLVSEFYDGLDDTPLGSVVSLNSEGASVQEVNLRSPSIISIDSDAASVQEVNLRSPSVITISSEESSDEEGPLQSPASVLDESADASVYEPSLGSPSTISIDGAVLPSSAENQSNSVQENNISGTYKLHFYLLCICERKRFNLYFYLFLCSLGEENGDVNDGELMDSIMSTMDAEDRVAFDELSRILDDLFNEI